MESLSALKESRQPPFTVRPDRKTYPFVVFVERSLMGLRRGPTDGLPLEVGLVVAGNNAEGGGGGLFSLLLMIFSASSPEGRGRSEMTCVTEEEKKSSTRY